MNKSTICFIFSALLTIAGIIFLLILVFNKEETMEKEITDCYDNKGHTIIGISCEQNHIKDEYSNIALATVIMIMVGFSLMVLGFVHSILGE